jgi:glycosyltransferase involved in cell wall biosynthesis
LALTHAPLLRQFLSTARAEGLFTALRRTQTFMARRCAPVTARLRRTAPARSADPFLPLWRSLARDGAFHVSAPPQVGRVRRQVALIGDLNLPQCRKYRVEQLVALWEAQGVTCQYAHYEDLPRASRLLQMATHLCEYRLPQSALTEALRYEARRLRLPILYDIDDPLFSLSALEDYGNLALLEPRRAEQFRQAAPGYLTMMNGADAISVTTPGLAKHTEQYSNRPIFLRRNFADRETLDLGRLARRQKPPDDGLFRFAFVTGSEGHEADFAHLAAALEEVILAHPARRLMILGPFAPERLPPNLRPRTEFIGFTDYGPYLGHLARADCLLIPLAESTFNGCKSGVRALDAAAVGVPVIASAVGDLPRVVGEESGWIAEAPSDWRRLMLGAATAPELCRRLGASAAESLEANWGDPTASHVLDPALLEWVTA